MVGQLLDGDLAGSVRVDHQHPIDMEVAGDLALLEVRVHGRGGRRVGEPRNEQHVVALDRDGPLREDALVV